MWQKGKGSVASPYRGGPLEIQIGAPCLGTAARLSRATNVRPPTNLKNSGRFPSADSEAGEKVCGLCWNTIDRHARRANSAGINAADDAVVLDQRAIRPGSIRSGQCATWMSSGSEWRSGGERNGTEPRQTLGQARGRADWRCGFQNNERLAISRRVVSPEAWIARTVRLARIV